VQRRFGRSESAIAGGMTAHSKIIHWKWNALTGNWLSDESQQEDSSFISLLFDGNNRATIECDSPLVVADFTWLH
jgi:hypothetical protein